MYPVPSPFRWGPRMSSMSADSVTMSTMGRTILHYEVSCERGRPEADADVVRHPRPAGPAAVVGLRADQAGPPQPPLLLAPGRDPPLSGAQEPRGARPGPGRHHGARPAAADGVRHHRQGPQGAAGLAGPAVGAAPAGVGG